MVKKYRNSLRMRLLAMLILLPTLGMFVFSVMAARLFLNDKKAYVFDSAVTVSKALATQVRLDISFFEKITEPIFEHIDPKTFKLNPEGGNLFNGQSSIQHLFVFEPMGNGIFEQADYIYLPKRTIPKFVPGGEVLEIVLKIAQDSGFAIQDLKEHKRFFLIAKKIGPVDSKKSPIALALYEAPYLYESFASPTGYKSYLLSKRNLISMSPRYIRDGKARTNITTVEFFKTLFFNKFPMGITEIKTPEGHPMYVSFAKVGYGELIVASVVDKKEALSAIDQFITESVLFLLGLLSLITMIGIVASYGLTTDLNKLIETTNKIAKGDFKAKPNIKSNNEIQQLADSIEAMSTDLQRLMHETAVQARMSSEIATVKATQAMLFPPYEAKIDNVDIASICVPASECGGDWLHYHKTAKNTVTIWVGDVTGHGASAALVTSAAKAVSSILELMPDLSPAQAMGIMNHAIYSTTKGSTLMTFFLGEIDLETGKLTYACASHESPYVIPNKDGVKKSDLVPLIDAAGPRLGEQPKAEYTEVVYQLQPGDSILMYTDGVVEMEAPDKSKLGERKFYQILAKAFKKNQAPKKTLDILRKEISSFQNGANLADDMVLYICKFSAKDKGPAASA